MVYVKLTQHEDTWSSGPGSLTRQKRMAGTGGGRWVEQLLFRAGLAEGKDNRNPFPPASMTSLYPYLLRNRRDLIQFIHKVA